MNFLSFKDYFKSPPKSETKFFRYIFEEEILSKFYTSTDYDNINHIIRRMLSPHIRYGANLELLRTCISRSIFSELCTALTKKERKVNDFEILQTVYDIISAELPEKSKLKATLISLKNISEISGALEIFILLSMLYFIFDKHYQKLEYLYDLSDQETYNIIYKNIIPASVVLENYHKYNTKSNANKSLLFTDKYISYYIKQEMKYNHNEIKIASLTGQYFFSEEIKTSVLPFLKSGGKMSIILSAPEVAEPIVNKMATVDNMLEKPEIILSKWEVLLNHYNIEIFITSLPILHNIVCIDDTSLHVYLYTYPDDYAFKQPQLELNSEDEYFDIFLREFEYLKNSSIKLKDYLLSK